MGDFIAQADADDLLAAFLWVAEGRIARETLDLLVADRESIQKRIEDARTRLESPGPFGWSCDYTRREMADLLNSYIEHGNKTIEAIRSLEATVTAQIAELQNTFGRDPRRKFTSTDAGILPSDAIWQAWEATFPLVDTYNAAVARDTAGIAELRKVEARRRAYVESRRGWTERDLQRCDPAGFEKLTADLLHRDGLTVLRRGGGARDQGADVIAVTPDGRRVVVQCKLRHRGSIRPSVLYEVNGTARQVHNADIPVVVTNGTFSANATAFAADYEIHLIDDYGVRRWAMWGESFYDILQLSPQ
ncbi:restriction endonuclease [Nocardia transvalensis]|uniref:restriction endonuclease n=1 Tax=Nocardia transvalensis TaxID=37333 RepID=UPI0018950469|nr:restriction endonuclease [Nocardia transvalensis]MBF6333225.1 restriction endonuclease [Nocardia transvalensis]